jgi:CheY-like chemotaxis protein
MITNDAKQILLVDDSMFFRTKIADILSAAGHSVVMAEDGEEALSEIKSSSGDIDLIILDLEMPNLDGFGVLEWMQKYGHTGKIPVVIVTGEYEEDEVMDRLQTLGVSIMITKDSTPEQIVFRVNKLLFPTENYKRVARRVPVSLAASFIMGTEMCAGSVLNLSNTGLFLKTKTKLIEGSIIHLTFTMPDGKNKIELKGIVKWITPPETKSDLFTGAGIMYTVISDKYQKAINDFTN